MDDLIFFFFFAKNDNEMKGFVNIARCFSDDNSMDFILNKCVKLTFNKRG